MFRLQSTLDAAFHRMAHGRDAVIVEGAGGLLVPMAPGVSYEDLCVRWMLDLLVVAANRLGVINHTALTVRSARRAGLRIVAVVLNTVTTRSPDVAEQTNLETLRTLLPGTAVLSFPFVRDPTHIPALVAAAAACGLPSSLPVPVPS